MNEQEIVAKHNRLDLSYRDFENRNKNLQNWKLDKYYIFEQIGQGGFSQIYRGMNGQTKKQVAIKVLDIRIVQSEKVLKIKRVRKRLIKEESKLMMKIDSPHILKCYECFQNRDLKIMIIEYCNQGTLGEKITMSKRIPEDQAISMLKQILNGIGQCHKLKIIHRDLKPDNILIHNGELKIADFGFSKQLVINNDNEMVFNTILGTPTTMAPQILEKKLYGLKADIWSIGVIFFWMIIGICPFTTNGKPEEILAQINNKLSQNIEEFNGVKPSEKVRKFLREILVVNPEKRLGWREILAHEIFKEENINLPANFYRQVEMKKQDESLFNMERQFMHQSRTTVVQSELMNQSEVASIENKQEISLEEQKIRQFSDMKKSDQEQKSLINLKLNNEVQQKFQKLDQPQTQNVNQSDRKQDQPIQKMMYQSLKNSSLSDKYKKEQLKDQRIAQKQSILQRKTDQIQQRNFIMPKQQRIRVKQPFLEIENHSGNKDQEKKIIQRNTYSLAKLKESEIHRLASSINRQEDELYIWAKKTHIECLKTEVIFNKIIKMIEKYNLLDIQNRNVIEMIYLLCTRCRNNISPIYSEYEKRKHSSVLKEISGIVENLYKDVTIKWVHYSNLLTKKQNEKIVIFKDWFSKIFNKDEFRNKDIFFTGVESMIEFKPKKAEQKITVRASQIGIIQEDLVDYNKEEQISFTNKYVQSNIKNLMNHRVAKEVLPYMKHFKSICLMDVKDTDAQMFKERLGLLILDKPYLQENFR